MNKKQIKELQTQLDSMTEDQLVAKLAEAMAGTMMDLIKICIEQRLRQMLPLIKEGFKK